METFKKISLLIALSILEQTVHAGMVRTQTQPATRNMQQYVYKKNMDHAFAHAADRLTRESYISPELQRDILAYLGQKDTIINVVTGEAQGIPSVNNVLDDIQHRLNYDYRQPILYAEQQTMKNALIAMLEATDIANFVASLEAAYRDQQYIFYQNVDAQLSSILNAQKTEIQTMLTAVNALQPYDQPANQTTSSLFSWFGTAPAPAAIMHHHVKPVHFNHHDETVKIPAEMMDAIIKKNSYKLETNADLAANLLFKQCFIAQQHHLKDAAWIDQLQIHLSNPITPENYIYAQFPNILELCNMAKSLVAGSPMRTSLQAPMTENQAVAHKLLLHIRQAVQTAMYIANAKSSYNISYILPTFIVKQLGGIVNQLLVYDADLGALCKDPMFGATDIDTYRDKNLGLITNVATGAATLALIAGTIYLGAPAAIASGAVKAGSFGYAKAIGAAKTVYDVGNMATSALPKWETVKATTDTIGSVGDMVTTAGGITTLTAGALRTADQYGYLPLDQIDPQARNVVDAVYKYGAIATAVGGTASTIGFIGSTLDNAGKAYNQASKKDNGSLVGTNKEGKKEWAAGSLYNYGKAVLDTKKAINMGTSVGATTVGGAIYLASLLGDQSAAPANNNASQPSYTSNSAKGYVGHGKAPADKHSYNQNSVPQTSYAPTPAPTQTPAPQPQTVTTEKLSQVLTKIITDNQAQGTNPLPTISEVSRKLIENKNISPEQLQQAFAQTEQNLNIPANSILSALQNGQGQATPAA